MPPAPFCSPSSGVWRKIIANQRNVSASLIATLASENAYAENIRTWVESAFARLLSKSSTAEMRMVAWALFPLYCYFMHKRGVDGYAMAIEKSRVDVNDPPQLLDLVASIVGHVSCARSGHMGISAYAENGIFDENVDPTATPSLFSRLFDIALIIHTGKANSVLYLPYTCKLCDLHAAPYSNRAPDDILTTKTELPTYDTDIQANIKSVSLREWLPYWFIASGKQQEETAVKFIRSMRQFVRHAPDEDLSLKESPLGQCVIRRLESSSRNMRITAIDTLLVYSQDFLNDSEVVALTKRSNRAETMHIVSSLTNESQTPSIKEESIQLLAGGVGRACKIYESTLGDVVAFMLGYYCADNIFLRAVAMEQLMSISQEHEVSLTRLLTIYASNIACTLAATLEQESPQMFIRCMQILETSPRQFLRQHVDIIVPHLVVHGNEAALNSVANILDVRLPVLCVNQAAVVFVKIFLMDDQLMHQAMLRFVELISAGSGMNSGQVEVNMPSLLRSCSVKLVFNLILALGEENSLLRKRARSALLTVRHILDNSSDIKQGVSTIVQHSVDNMRDISANHSPKPGGKLGSSSYNEGLAEFLSQHILGVLAHVNELLRNSDQPQEFVGESSSTLSHYSGRLKQKALRAIGELVALLGSHTTPHTSSIIASLSPPLGGPLTACALHSWETLAESLMQTPVSADQVNALIVPLLTVFFSASESARQKVALTINKIAKLHEHNIKQHHKRLCPIPDDPLLSASYETYKRCSASDPLRQKLANLTAMLKAKDSTFILCASRALCLLITQHPKLVSVWKIPYYLGFDTSSTSLKGGNKSHDRGSSFADAALVNNMINALKSACDISSRLGEIASASCTACLALIGGINARALSRSTEGCSNMDKEIQESSALPALYKLDNDEERLEFVCTLIVDHLSQAFARAPSPGVQICAAYGIQELLRLVGFTKTLLYGNSDDKNATDGTATTSKRKKRDSAKRSRDSTQSQWLQQRWDMFPPSITEAIKPLLDSKYTIQPSSRFSADNQLQRVPCILCSTCHLSWLCAWVVDMANALPPSPASNIFKVCISAMKESSADMLLFFLPQIAYKYCLYKYDAGDKTEVAAIEVKDDDDSDEATCDNKSRADDSSRTNILAEEIQAVLSFEVDAMRMPADQWRLCKETTLDLLDTFSAYVREQQKIRISGKRGARKDSKVANTTDEESALLLLTSSVPHTMIAAAAASCHQYERALLHIEMSLRNGAFGKYPTIFGNINDATMASIQELYFSMEDADGVAGSASCRKQIDHRMLIRKYEIEGNWSHALIGHESLLRSQPDNEEFQKGWISCLQNMGQWESAWAASKELCQSRPQNESNESLKSACFAAAWRLGKWDWVQTDISDTSAMTTSRTTVAAPNNLLPSFDALNSAILLRVGHTNSTSALKEASLPLPLRVYANSSIESSEISLLDSSLAKLMSFGLRSIGRSIAETLPGSLRQTLLNTSTTAGSSSMQHEIHAHMIGDIAIFAEQLQNIAAKGWQSHSCPALQNALSSLFRQWGERVACLPPMYSVQEPVLALHTRICDIVANSLSSFEGTDKDATSQRRCSCLDSILRQSVFTRHQAAQLARLAGFRATALGILIHAETTCSTAPALLAPLQIERAQILWDEGHAADAMSSISRVVDSLSKKLDMPDTISDSGPSLAFGATAAGTGAAANTSKNSLSPSHSELLFDRDRDGPEASHGLLDVQETKAAFAKAALLLSRWQEITNSVTSLLLFNRYEKIIRIQESDKVYYACGHLYDRIFSTVSDKDVSQAPKGQQEHRSQQMAGIQYYMVRYYSRTVMCSSRFLYQALPRLLTVWLDFGANILKAPDSKYTRTVDRFKTTNRVVHNLAKRLPAYNFLVVLSQLVSRICHPNEDVFAVLEVIILGVLELYPQQALWQMMGVQRSTYAARSERCNAILAKARVSHGADTLAGAGARGRSRSVGGLIQQASRLTDMLLGLCNALPPARTITTMHMSKDFKTLAKSTPLDVIVPLQKCLVPTLPNTPSGAEHELTLLSLLGSSCSGGIGEFGNSSQSVSQRAMLHQPFPNDLPTISGFAEEIEVMHSLQRPKKITVIGSDGQNYSFLCKPKDDLRKDARLMEFNSMINQLLSSQTQTQKRGLYIRTYAVVPLNEECGLIQWVGPTTGIRHVLLKLYKAHNVTISMAQVKSILDNGNPSPEEQFTKKLLPLFPSVLHEWFLQSFPDPCRWLASRTNFTRSAAVMSMVGHILGLGDRHCENILLDESTGGVVHVDFNCLFEKGLTLEKPEKVPFRLTHNMVDAMGATGYEGAFRKTCEMTLSLLREHQDALMSVLESFLHDPLVEWSKRTTRSASRSAAIKDPTVAGQQQQPNEHASRSLNTIRKKLQGSVQGATVLSVEGQVDELIREATDPKRLFQMYIGWAAYM
ncbi:hypothetical protein BX070DRAFT_227651 [Coemansia spiralis]|nr:hypothetical protein BX070DRAFT_227651 [Coemansia spiralis]